MSTILESVKEVAVGRLRVEPERLDCVLPLEASGVDSLSRIDLMFTIEDHFGVTFGADALRSVRSLKDIAAHIAQYPDWNFLS